MKPPPLSGAAGRKNRLLAALAGVVGFSACLLLPPSALGRAREDTPQSLFEKGEKQMRRGYFEEAINTFDKVRTQFPMNEYSARAELRVADCYYEKGEYLVAVDSYRSFERLHPDHPEVDYAVFRAAQSQFRMSHITAQRDQSTTDLCVKALDGFEERFPASVHLPEVVKMRQTARKRLSRRVETVANYYYWRGSLGRGASRGTSYWAAARRYQQLVDEFADVKDLDRARFRLGMARLRVGDLPGARSAFAGLTPPPEGGRPSRWVVRANRALTRPPRAVPPPEERVDEIRSYAP